MHLVWLNRISFQCSILQYTSQTNLTAATFPLFLGLFFCCTQVYHVRARQIWFLFVWSRRMFGSRSAEFHFHRVHLYIINIHATYSSDFHCWVLQIGRLGGNGRLQCTASCSDCHGSCHQLNWWCSRILSYDTLIHCPMCLNIVRLLQLLVCMTLLLKTVAELAQHPIFKVENELVCRFFKL